MSKEEITMTDWLIIGAGAAGLACAVTASSLGDTVCLLERMDRPGKKLLATGNGRCNLMNSQGLRYPQGRAFAADVLRHMPYQKQMAFWRYLGVFLREEEDGRVYPVTGQASTVLDALRLPVQEWIVPSHQVRTISKRAEGWHAACDEGSFAAKHILIATGGCSQSKLGSDGSGIRLLEQLGYPSAPCRPALTQLETEKEPVRGLEGIRVRAQVHVLADGRRVHSENGEVLFTAYGLSGISIMQCASYAYGPRSVISLDFSAPLGLERTELLQELEQRKDLIHDAPPFRLLTGFLVPRLAQAVCRQAKISDRGPLRKTDLNRLMDTLCDYRVPVTKLRGFDASQVTRGGIATDDFRSDTLESRRHPGLFAAGEVLDVDGDCGGFNLMFAFASGILAGLNGRKAPWEE